MISCIVSVPHLWLAAVKNETEQMPNVKGSCCAFESHRISCGCCILLCLETVCLPRDIFSLLEPPGSISSGCNALSLAAAEGCVCFAVSVCRLMNAHDSAPLSVRKVQEVFTRPWGLWLQSNSHLVNCTIICCSLCGKKNKGSLIPLCFLTLGGYCLNANFHIKSPLQSPIWLIIPAGSRGKGPAALCLSVIRRRGVVCWPDTIQPQWPACGWLAVAGWSSGTVCLCLWLGPTSLWNYSLRAQRQTNLWHTEQEKEKKKDRERESRMELVDLRGWKVKKREKWH